MSTQLLCTFCDETSLDIVLKKIKETYQISFNTIYILKNKEDGSLCCTYNVYQSDIDCPPPATISLHRKKLTNTLYTINALNLLIEELNNGKRDKRFQIPWEDYENTIIVSAYGNLKIIHTELVDIIKFGTTNGE